MRLAGKPRIGTRGTGCSAAPYQKPSLEQKRGLKDGLPLGLESAASYQPRAALAVESRKTLEIS
jgi:hypothetical protein